MQAESWIERLQQLDRLPRAVHHLVAAALVLLFFGVRYVLDEELGGYPFLLFFPPLILSSVLLNRGSGFTALGLSTLLTWFFFLAPNGAFASVSGSEALALGLFIAIGMFAVLAIEGLRLAATQLTRTKKRLNDQVTLLNAITESVPDPIFVKNKDGYFVHANSALSSVLGVARNNLVGHHDREFMSVNEAAAIEAVDREVTGKGEVRVVEERVTPVGETQPRTYLSTKAPWRDAQGEILGVIGIARDIDARKTLEEQLRATSELNRILLFDINHRLKNQLQAVGGMLLLAVRDVQDETARSALATAARRLIVLARVNDRLHLREDGARVRALEFIEPLCDDLRSGLIDGRPIALRTLIDPQIELDPQRAVSVGLIINELVANALKYAFPDDRDGAVSIRFDEVGKEYSLVVMDNGVGFDPATSRQGSGTRLVRLLAQQLGADLSWRSNDGTHVHVRFSTTEREPLTAQ